MMAYGTLHDNLELDRGSIRSSPKYVIGPNSKKISGD